MSDWTWSANWRAFQKATRRIYPLEGGLFVISRNRVWLPGAFATREAAERAFDESYVYLSELQQRKNEEAGGSGGVITLEDFEIDPPSSAP